MNCQQAINLIVWVTGLIATYIAHCIISQGRFNSQAYILSVAHDQHPAIDYYDL